MESERRLLRAPAVWVECLAGFVTWNDDAPYSGNPRGIDGELHEVVEMRHMVAVTPISEASQANWL